MWVFFFECFFFGIGREGGRRVVRGDILEFFLEIIGFGGISFCFCSI